MNAKTQLKRLASYPADFADHIREHLGDNGGLRPATLTTFQMNVGTICNQACTHCHVGASPTRTETMNLRTVETCLKIIAEVDEIEIVDITGGAPEMNEHFAFLVTEAKRLGKNVIDRCNLTILEHPDHEHLYGFLADNDVEVIASLPHFARDHTDRQRGRGVFDKSITALHKLNELGYGDSRTLNLVYNPAGIFLAAPQKQLEREFKENLKRQHGIVFNNLYCINNVAINRFLERLERRGKLDTYLEILVNAFNPATLDGLMCRRQISVSYDGHIYDCDFNQMLNMSSNGVAHVDNFDYSEFIARKIRTANHCFSCTAGAGSSCTGETASPPSNRRY
jgi:radical SAM/Cys-rich protein